MNVTCYIIDDEMHAIDVLIKHINKTEGITLAGYSQNPMIALEEINRLQPDFILLDIDMPVVNGLKLATIINQKTLLVFTTAFREYGPDAFDKNAADYLLKPISYERFLVSYKKVRLYFQNSQHQSSGAPTCFYLKTGTKGRLIKVLIKDILYIGGAINYIEIFFATHKVMAYFTLAEIIEKLPVGIFFRIHKSYIVNIDHIAMIDNYQVKLDNDVIIPIGRSYYSEFLAKMNALIIQSNREQAI